jgi:hypothetical protein
MPLGIAPLECTLTGRAGLRAAVHTAEEKRRADWRAVLEL